MNVDEMCLQIFGSCRNETNSPIYSFLALCAIHKICTDSPCMFWYKPRLINGVVICQTHILDIDMNRNCHLLDSYIRHWHKLKGGVINFFTPSRGGVENF